jgi:hypothetical protein
MVPLLLVTLLAASPETVAPEKPVVTVARALLSSVGSCAAGTSALVALVAWGALLGAAFGLLGAAGTRGVMAPVPNVLLMGGFGALLGGLVMLPLGVLTRLVVDGVAWASVTGQAGAGNPALWAEVPVLLATGFAVGVMVLGGAAVVWLRAPQGGLTRDPLGAVVLTLAVAGAVAIPTLPLVTALSVGRGMLWWWLSGHA